MNGFWVLGLILAALAVIYVVRRWNDSKHAADAADAASASAAEHQTASRPGQAHTPTQWPAIDAEESDDTAPAVLSPPEWKEPDRNVSGTRRR